MLEAKLTRYLLKNMMELFLNKNGVAFCESDLSIPSARELDLTHLTLIPQLRSNRRNRLLVLVTRLLVV